MALVSETFEMYVGLRTRGQDATTALQTLRFQIELLDADSRAEIVRRVREWEAERKGESPTNNITKTGTAAAVKPIKPLAVTPPNPLMTPAIVPPVIPPLPATPAPVTVTPPAPKMIACPQCQKPNPANEVFCYSCGYFLKTDASFHDTVRLNDPDQKMNRSDFFGPNSTLVLLVTNTNQSYKIRPQQFNHEIVIGRADGATMRPDVDLSEQGAGNHGVSRLHMSLAFNSKLSTLTVSDMRSANGTFINGQRLYPQEVRVLRHGDELRLGRLVLRAYFYHPESP